MPAAWRGFYINLDASGDRRQAVAHTLGQAGIADAYERFAAIDGAGKPPHCPMRPGQYGVFRSHHALLTGLTPDGRYIHVMEDDAVVARVFAPVMHNVLAAGLMDAFDVVFTETMVMDNLPLIRMYKSLYDRSTAGGQGPAVSLIDMKTGDFAGMTSYFVNPRSTAKVVDCLARGLAQGPQRPVDVHLRDEARAGRLKVGLLFPFLTSIDTRLPSTIGGETPSGHASLLLRRAFFVDTDVGSARREMGDLMRHIGGMPEDARLDLITDILRFMASSRFQGF